MLPKWACRSAPNAALAAALAVPELKLLSVGAPLQTAAHPAQPHATPPAVQYGNITFDLDQMAIFYQVPFNCSIGGMDT